MVERTRGQTLAESWVDAWKRGDFSGIHEMVSDDFEFWAPATIEFDRRAKGVLRGRSALGRYWERIQQNVEAAGFKLLSTLTYPNSIAVYYSGNRGRLSAESFHFGPDGKIAKIYTLVGEGLTLGAVQHKLAA